ncbi:MAG: MerR family transcriptional regulator [Clostridiales bacterium]|nr:MerR family transcriptional regulator [Clostridiales bacterium]
MYTVKQVAKMLNLTEHTVRFYTDKGLVPKLKRDKNNIRIFDDEAIHWLTGVKYLKECGMSIASIKQFIDLCVEGDATIPARYEIILAQTKLAQEQLEQAKQRVAYMEYKKELYQEIVNQTIPDTTNPGQWSKLPIHEAI